MQYKEIPVEDLKYGMYVAELDRPWVETPFMFQGFVLRTEKQSDALKKYCKHVFVDPEKEDLADLKRPAPVAEVRGNTVYKELAPVEVELPQARSVYVESTNIVKQISRAARTEATVDSTQAKEAASQITDSVVRNPDAMTLLVKMREKSNETLDRAVEVSVTMTIFGRFLQLSREQLDTLGMLGLLQDIGLLKLPVTLVNKRSELPPEDIDIFKSHVSHSVEILSKTQGLPADLPGLASLHHERYDGSGYPRGIRGSAIPLLGAMAAIVEEYDSLTAPQPYGQQLSPSKALGILFKGRGTQFHPALVEQFIQCIGVFPVGSAVELNSGEVGVVVAQNPVRRLQPRVMVVKDAKGKPMSPHRLLDLMKDPKTASGEVYRIRSTLEYDDNLKVDPRELFL